MVRKYDILFFVGESGSRDILIPADVSMLRFELKSGTMTAMGYLDRESDPQPLSGISAKDYSVNLNMQGPGIFTIETSGLWKVTMNYSNGSDEVAFKTIV